MFIWCLSLFSPLFGFLVALVLIVYSTAFDCFVFVIPHNSASTVSSSLCWTPWLFTILNIEPVAVVGSFEMLTFLQHSGIFPECIFCICYRLWFGIHDGQIISFCPILMNWEFSEKIPFCNHHAVVNTVLCSLIFLQPKSSRWWKLAQQRRIHHVL